MKIFHSMFKFINKKNRFNKLFNCYGATDYPHGHFITNSKKMTTKLLKKQSSPYWKKFRGLKTFINSERELCISGPVLSKGYMKKIKIKKDFFKNRIRFYNTGDVCKNLRTTLLL